MLLGNVIGNTVDSVITSTIQRFTGAANGDVGDSRSGNLMAMAAVADSVKKLGNFDEFKELRSRTIWEVLPELDLAYVNFCHDHCMKKCKECDAESIIDLSDPDRVFIAKGEYAPDVSVECARKIGLTVPDDLAKKNPKLKIRPLVVRFYGVGSGETISQITEAAKILFNVKTDILAKAEEQIMPRIKLECEKFANREDIRVGVIFAGFSFGGPFATAMAVKNKLPSVVFNPLTCGPGVCEFIGLKNWNDAVTLCPNRHTTIVTDRDFVSADGSILRRMGKLPGRVIIMDNADANPVATHCEYRKKFGSCLMEAQRKFFDKLAAVSTNDDERGNNRERG
jgi:hypothetical protein